MFRDLGLGFRVLSLGFNLRVCRLQGSRFRL